MRKTLKEKWINALKSGDYIQGKGALKKRIYPMQDKLLAQDQYCCLGVLIECLGADPDKPSKYADPSTAEELHDKGLKLVGLTRKQQNRLIEMNDGHFEQMEMRRTFKQIATWIKRYL